MNDLSIYKPEKYSPEQVRQIFGKGSSSLSAHQLSKRDPQAYADMRILAVYRDRILGEDSLKPNQTLTRQQLDEHYRREKAAAENALIEVPPQMCDRLGLPQGTKVTWENLQKTMGRQPI